MFTIDLSTLTAVQVQQLADDKLSSDLREWEKNIWQFLSDWFNPSVEAIAVETSGSTGKPKTIAHRKEFMRNSARMTCEALQLKKASTALLCLPANKISGIMMLVRAIENQMNLICIEPSVNPLSKLNDETKIDFAALTPMQFMETLQNYEVFRRADGISCIILGGEGIGNELYQNIRKMNNAVYATFGMTETISHIALKRLTGKVPEIFFRLLSGISLSIDGKSCMVINAPLLGQTNLITNDVINLISETEFEWRGRADNVINSGGMKLYPENIEEIIRPDITVPFFITAVPDSLAGQRPGLVIERENITKEELDKLKVYVNKLDKKIQPKLLYLVPKFLNANNGKLRREETLQTVTAEIFL